MVVARNSLYQKTESGWDVCSQGTRPEDGESAFSSDLLEESDLGDF